MKREKSNRIGINKLTISPHAIGLSHYFYLLSVLIIYSVQTTTHTLLYFIYLLSLISSLAEMCFDFCPSFQLFHHKLYIFALPHHKHLMLIYMRYSIFSL